MSFPFIGEVRIFPYNFAPLGWAFCDGQLLAISQNDALFSLIGTSYGGDGQVTFALPNLQGRSPLGFGQGPGLSNYAIGDQGGVENVTLLATHLPPHTHTLRASSAPATESTPNDTRVLAEANTPIYAPAGNLVPMPQLGGVGQPHPNRQPFLAVHFCIALEGIYPPGG